MKAYGYYTQGELLWDMESRNLRFLKASILKAMKEFPDLMYFLDGVSRNHQVIEMDGKIDFIHKYEEQLNNRTARCEGNKLILVTKWTMFFSDDGHLVLLSSEGHELKLKCDYDKRHELLKMATFGVCEVLPGGIALEQKKAIDPEVEMEQIR